MRCSHLIRATGVAALIATHNLELARRMDRVLRSRTACSSRFRPPPSAERRNGAG